ncbi:phosphoheptose isomerase [Pedobacter xixiisoli]|uniref:Mannose-6-phosphate isomerase, cupin superfamily n=1 Tax=Pedobacter xixiisoli TaxID=1476464 RepID=A0A286A0A8_9SPHI|nr:phosphoheptose isomerase [Pedobacter xixiisoli]SOD15339.1 Mannose-6-phosphate isomerase, cupin superfamily [Pedobacter xixiisoli]
MDNNKNQFFNKVEQQLVKQGLKLSAKDFNRPWGGFFVIDEEQAQYFADLYFDGINVDELRIGGKLSPKVLVVAPEQRLSWQYHHGRAEIWQVIEGNVGIVRSDTDLEGELKIYHKQERIVLKQGERHRLIGLSDWGIVAEIWQHTNPGNPSDENDIVRIQDDYSR